MEILLTLNFLIQCLLKNNVCMQTLFFVTTFYCFLYRYYFKIPVLIIRIRLSMKAISNPELSNKIYTVRGIHPSPIGCQEM